MRPQTALRKAAKAAVLPLGFAGRAGPEDVVILLYHRVAEAGGEIDLPAALFERQVALLAGRRVRTLEEAFGDDPGGIVVTFDDGYRDFTDVVVPMLVRYRIPALLYLATGLVANGGPPAPDRLTWGALAEAVATGLVTVGAHTHGHTDLSRADERTATEEMRRCQELIEDHLGVACRHFAYPWAVGGPGADAAARRLFDTAALGAWETNRPGRTDPYRLGRVPILHSDGVAFFRAKARGGLNGERLLYRALGRGPWRRA